MNLDEIISSLKAPFPFEETECKIQAANEDKSRGMAVFYIDSRAIQNRLDKIVGPFCWHNEYMLWQDKSQICGISIYDETRGMWVTKYDGAENTDYEPIKGGLSDSFKRAAVMWGLGRYLYDIDGLWVEIEQRGKSSYVKNSEQQKLRDHYNKFINKQGSDGGGSDRQKSLSGTNSGQSRPNTAAQSGLQNNSSSYGFKVQSAIPSGNSTCLKLINTDGKEITAYVKKDSPGIVPGVRIVNTQMEKRQKDDWTYYMLNKYDVAA